MRERPNKEITEATENKPFDNSKSRTKVYQRLHGQRGIVSIRVKPELQHALLEFCKANGLSLCHVYEMLVIGYLTGMKQKIEWVNQSPTIELTVVREVKRLRRTYTEYELETNFYNPRTFFWEYVDTKELNDNGHVDGCGCSKCR